MVAIISLFLEAWARITVVGGQQMQDKITKL
jgi:hypothetical protein